MIYRAGDFFFETGDVSHRVNNKPVSAIPISCSRFCLHGPIKGASLIVPGTNAVSRVWDVAQSAQGQAKGMHLMSDIFPQHPGRCPTVAPKHPTILSKHGISGWTTNYWLRHKQEPGRSTICSRERLCRSSHQAAQPLRTTLYKEMVGASRNPICLCVPVTRLALYSRTEAGKQYSHPWPQVRCRWLSSARAYPARCEQAGRGQAL